MVPDRILASPARRAVASARRACQAMELPEAHLALDARIYQAGVDDHWRMGTQEWREFGACAAWATKCKVTALHGSPVVQSLWQ